MYFVLYSSCERDVNVKKIFILFVLMLIMPIMVNAESVDKIIINQNGVSIEENTYQKLCDIYSKNFVDTLTLNEYKKIASVPLDEIVVSESSIDTETMPLDASFSSNAKTIKLIKSGNYITLLATWKGVPSVKSNDVIAVRFDNASLDGSFTFKQVYVSNGSMKVSYDSYNKRFSNGFGSSFQLGNGSGIEISLMFMVSGNGKVYGSYQHASSYASLTDSTKYTLSYLGNGGVILFDESVRSKYDAMPGVDISV